MKDRIIWIDYAKFIGIYLVVLGHLPINVKSIIFIYSFHMPLFFFLSGYLYKKSDNMKNNFKYNICSLIVPYILLYCIYWIYPLTKGIVSGNFTWTDNIIKPFYGLCFGNGYSDAYYTMLNVPLYFLVALFWIRMGFYLYERINYSWIRIFVLFCCIAFIYIRNSICFDFYLSIDSAIMAFPFFVMGNNLSHTKWLNTFFNKKQFIWLTLIISIPLSIFLCIYNGRVDINHCVYGLNLFLFYISGVVGILMTIALSSLFSRQSFIQCISNGTMLIIAFGGISSNLVFIILKSWSVTNDVKYAVSALGSLILLYPVIKYVQKYFPILLGKGKY